MDTIVAFYSVYGNTEALAHQVADEIRALGPVRLLRLESVLAGDLRVDLLVVSTPTHAFGLPQAVRPVLARLPDGSLGGVRVAAFDTAMSWWPLSALTAAPKVLRRLRHLGGVPVAPPASFHVAATEGPLVEGERARAAGWAREIVRVLAAEAPPARTAPAEPALAKAPPAGEAPRSEETARGGRPPPPPEQRPP